MRYRHRSGSSTERGLILRHPVSVTLVSFVWPGAGHALLGQRRLGLVLAVPQLLLVTLAVLALARNGAMVASVLVTPSVLIGLVGLDLVVLGTRIVALIDAPRRVVGGERRASAAVAITATLVIALIGVSSAVHGRAAQLGWTAHETLTTVFSPSGPRGAAFGGGRDAATAAPSGTLPSPSASPSPSPMPASPAPVTSSPRRASPSPSPTPSVPPSPTHGWQDDGRLNVLLIGSDAGPGRWKLRTDTMIVLSVDVEDGSAALVGVPRNVRFAPMPPPLDSTFPDGFPDLLNSLWIWVQEHPGSYPGEPAVAPFHALRDTVALLLGVPIDGMAVVELEGFVRAVDALGGVEVTVPEPVHDDAYPHPDGTGTVGLSIPAGEQWMDGWHALAYARSRNQDSDYQRMQRQQTVLLALQDQLRCQVASHIGELLVIARDTLWIDLPLTDLPDMIRVAEGVDPERVSRLTLTPPRFPVVLDDGALTTIRAAVAELIAEAPPPGDAAEDPRACPEPVIPDEAS